MDDLDLDLELNIESLVSKGRKKRDLAPEILRPLQAADLVALAENRETPAINIKRLSERHHGLARLLAAGTPPGEAAIIMRYEPARVSILQGDPAFKELVEFYRNKVDEAFEGQQEQIAGLSRDALSEIQTRLEDDPTQFSTRELRELATTMLDRSGHGPSSKQEINVVSDMGLRIEAARKRALEARKQGAIEGQVVDVTPEASNG